jgi:hypothetical protein
MSPTTKSAFEGADSPLRPVSLDPSHFRSGRWFLLAEGVVLVAVGAGGLIAAARHPGAGRAGAPLLGLALTPTHSAVLLGFGVIAVCATIRRRPTVIVTGVGVVAFLLLFTIGTVAAVRSAPGPLGFDLRDSVLHAVLLVFNLALLMWLVVNALEGPAWVRRRRRQQGTAQGDGGGDRQ